MPDRSTDLPLIDEPLSVVAVGREIVLDGALPLKVSMTRDAALETGIDMVNTALGLTDEEDAAEPSSQ